MRTSKVTLPIYVGVNPPIDGSQFLTHVEGGEMKVVPSDRGEIIYNVLAGYFDN